MGRATDIELVIRYLMQMKAGEWIGTQAQLVRRLTETGWLQDRAERAVVRTINEDCGLHVGRGGTLKFSNADVALYSQVAQQLERWQPMKGWRVDEVLDVHAKKGLRGQGKWQYPDLLVLADPRRRLSPDDPLEMHSIEVERRSGFSVQSVYQAHEQGRGANYSWVMFAASDADSDDWKAVCSRLPSGRNPVVTGRTQNERILRAAIEVGIGLVLMRTPHARSTWREIWSPTRRKDEDVDPLDRDLLLRAVGMPGGRLGEHRSAVRDASTQKRRRITATTSN